MFCHHAVCSWQGWLQGAFVVNVYARRIQGWWVSRATRQQQRFARGVNSNQLAPLKAGAIQSADFADD